MTVSPGFTLVCSWDATSAAIPVAVNGSISVKNVVGQGLGNVDVDANGRLLNPQLAVENGTVSAKAYLKVTLGPAGLDCGTPVSSTELNYRILLNGTVIGTMSRVYGTNADGTGAAGGSSTQKFTVDIGLVRFATRIPNSTPIPGVNIVRIEGNSGQIISIFNQTENDGIFGTAFATLEFSSMAPIVLVHGIQTGPWWWGPHPSTVDPCLVKPHHAQFDGGFNFIQTLQTAAAPFVCKAVQIQGEDSDGSGDASISDGGRQLTAILDQISAEFGTNHLHFIAHSKGGFWTRAVLPSLESRNIGRIFGDYYVNSSSWLCACGFKGLITSDECLFDLKSCI